MAERYETKLSVRPLSERKPAGSASGESDPLVELTRIVTGRSTFDPPPSAKNRTVPAAGPAPAPGAGLANDLESELLNDLQASFAAVREPGAPVPPPSPAPQPAARAPAAAPPPAARAQPAASAPAASPRPERITPASRGERPAALAPPYAPAPSPRAERPPAPAAPPAGQTLADRPSFFRSGSGPTVDLSHIQMRPSAPAASPEAAAPPVRQPSPRWDRPEEGRGPAVETPSRFAPPRAAAFRPAEEPEAGEPELGYADEAPFADEEPYQEEFALADLNTLPEYGEEGELPPFPEDELAGLSRRRGSRALILIAGVLVVALAGGLAYVMLGDSGSTATPPIIAADATPTKVAPEQSAAAEPVKESDRVDALDNPDDTNLVTPGESDVAGLSPAEADNNPISRVIVPAGPGFDAPITEDGATPPADETSDPASIGPKKVRTVVVRPDGTIVSSAAAPVADAATPAPDADATPPPEDAIPLAADATSPAEATPPEDVAAATPAAGTDMDAVLDAEGGDLPVDTDPLATGAQATEPAAGTVPAEDATPVAGADATPPAAEPTAAAAEPDVAVAKPPVKPSKPAKPTVVASGAPLDITPATPAAAPAPSGGGVLVQLSSQRSEDAALSAYEGLQRRYPGILGDFKPSIQRADLGERGTYYRVRVGPFSGSDAQRLCGDLKAAGGDCIIAR